MSPPEGGGGRHKYAKIVLMVAYICSAYKLNKYIKIDSMFSFYLRNSFNYKGIQNFTKITNCYIYRLFIASICN